MLRSLYCPQNTIKYSFTGCICRCIRIWDFLGGSVVKKTPAKQETQVLSLGQKYSLEKEMETHSNILAWEIPWTEEPGRLQPMGSQSVRHDLVK